jgi:hypothetical protein
MPKPLVDLPPLPKPDNTPAPVYKSLFTDTALQGASINWHPEVLNTKLPTVYTPQPIDNSAVDQANRSLGAAITGYNKAAADALVAAREQAQKQQALPNTPQVDQHGTNFGSMLGDFFFGNQKARAQAERGEWNFNGVGGDAVYGRKGAGLLGTANYIFSTAGSAALGVIADGVRLRSDLLQKLGVDKKTADTFAVDGVLGFIPGAPKSSDVLALNVDAVRKEGSATLGALRGQSVNDINDPKSATELGTGRVFYRKQREDNSPFWSDPVGFGLQTAFDFLNPFDNGVGRLMGKGLGAVFNRGTAKVTQEATQEAARVTQALPLGKPQTSPFPPQPPKPPLDLSSINEEQFNRLNRGTPKLESPANQALPKLRSTGDVELAPLQMQARLEPKNTPTIATPTKVIHVDPITGKAEQRFLLPAVDYELVPPTNATYVLPHSSPSHTALQVGIGKPSAFAITDPGALDIRTYPEMIQTIASKEPKLLTGYDGTTWADLKEHLVTGKWQTEVTQALGNNSNFKNTGDIADKLDFSQFNVVGKKLAEETPDIGQLWSQGKVSNEEYFKWEKGKAPVNIEVPAPPSVDDLAHAAQELAGHKLTLSAPIKQLEELFQSTADFGRKHLGELGLKPISAEDIGKVLDNGGRPNLASVVDQLPYGRLLRTGDVEGLQKYAQRTGEDSSKLLEQASAIHNSYLSSPTPVNRALETSPVGLVKLPNKPLFHGSAISNWLPNYNISVHGSRGELGSGLYLTSDANVAKEYARARMGENVSPNTLDLNIDLPAINQVSHQLTSTLNAKAKLPTSSDFFRSLQEGLPPELVQELKKTWTKKKDNTYSGFLNQLETSMVKAGIEPTEESLQAIQKTVSDNLRKLGYDSVHDNKSGFTMALDENALKVTDRTPVPQPDATEAVLSRYNADAYASKFFPERPTADANLRDSSHKLLSQLSDNVDRKLAEVHGELQNRLGADTPEGILPKLPEKAPTATSKPQTVQDIMSKIDSEISDLCSL